MEPTTKVSISSAAKTVLSSSFKRSLAGAVERPLNVAPEEAADFEYFRNVLNRLQDFRSKRMSETLRDICAEIDWDRDRFQLYYITLRQLTTDQANTKEWTALPMVPAGTGGAVTSYTTDQTHLILDTNGYFAP